MIELIVKSPEIGNINDLLWHQLWYTFPHWLRNSCVRSSYTPRGHYRTTALFPGASKRPSAFLMEFFSNFRYLNVDEWWGLMKARGVFAVSSQILLVLLVLLVLLAAPSLLSVNPILFPHQENVYYFENLRWDIFYGPIQRYASGYRSSHSRSTTSQITGFSKDYQRLPHSDSVGGTASQA